MLSRPHRRVAAGAAGTVFRSAHDAIAALRGGRIGHLVGALPFTPSAPAALWAPDELTVTDTPRGASGFAPDTPNRSPHRRIRVPRFGFTDALPTPERHLHRVGTAIDLLRNPAHPIRKVVLARAVEARSPEPVRPHDILDLLVSSDPLGNGFLVDLAAAGGRYPGRHLVGASPEVLVRRDGTAVSSHPLAGSARRVPEDPDADRAAATELRASGKDLAEHRFVVDQVTAVLRDRCAEVHSTAPELTGTPTMWHLGTPITATVPLRGPSALELAAALHPTPAVCGTPTAAAARLIAELEGDRGFYAGAVGWCDADGNGEWMVAIRCAELSADGTVLRAHAGGGIVADSDPAAELAETTGKLARILGPLGLADLPVSVG